MTLNLIIVAVNWMIIITLYLQALQLEQEQEIAQLEKEVEELSFQHENKIRAYKTQFLKEKKAYEESATARIKNMAEQASKVSHQIR